MNDLGEYPRWQVCEQPWEPQRNQVWESLFTTGNGYLGIRGHPDEAFDAGPSLRGIYVAGVYAPDQAGIPELVNLPDVFAVDILLQGRHVRLRPERVTEYRRVLDLRSGVLRRELVYVQGKRATRLCFERFASLAAPHLAGQQITVTPLNWSGTVEVRLLIDAQARNLSRRQFRMLQLRRVGRDRVLASAVTRDARIRLGTAFRTHAWVHQTRPPEPVASTVRRGAGISYRCELEAGQRACFDRVIAVHTSRDPDSISVERQCLAAIHRSTGPSYGSLLRAHKTAWDDEWLACDVEIDGPQDDQRAIRFAIFQLRQACSRFDPTVSIGAKALSGEAYRGHVFWDTEIFILPLFVHTQPRAARRLLEYRCRLLDGARHKAARNGYAGAMFPWESADTGDETCPRYVPDPRTGEPVRVWTGELEQHITADVAYAAHRYVEATGDGDFQEQWLHTLAVETARFWASRVEWSEDRGRYEIRDVIGPDEYHEHVDNNAFTNYMAAWNLRLGAATVRMLLEGTMPARVALGQQLGVSREEAGRWERMAARLFIPYDESRGIHAQHEGFLELAEADASLLSVRQSTEPEKVRMPRIWASQVLKQADVVMLMNLFPDAFGPQTKKANFDYYEPRTTHDSSLSPSGHALLAADLGMRDKAYEYFRWSAFTDLEDRMGNTADGLHAAAMGGTWQAVVFGLLGLRYEDRRSDERQPDDRGPDDLPAGGGPRGGGHREGAQPGGPPAGGEQRGGGHREGAQPDDLPAGGEQRAGRPLFCLPVLPDCWRQVRCRIQYDGTIYSLWVRGGQVTMVREDSD